MEHHEIVAALFYNRGHSFDDIIRRGKLGGIPAIQSYLVTRRSMWTSALSRAAAQGQDIRTIQHAIRAFDEALALLPKLNKTSRTKALLEALGPRHLVGLK